MAAIIPSGRPACAQLLVKCGKRPLAVHCALQITVIRTKQKVEALQKIAAPITAACESRTLQRLKCPSNWWFVSVHGSGLVRPHDPCQLSFVEEELKLAEFRI
jgi:hypothetical protein